MVFLQRPLQLLDTHRRLSGGHSEAPDLHGLRVFHPARGSHKLHQAIPPHEEDAVEPQEALRVALQGAQREELLHLTKMIEDGFLSSLDMASNAMALGFWAQESFGELRVGCSWRPSSLTRPLFRLRGELEALSLVANGNG